MNTAAQRQTLPGQYLQRVWLAQYPQGVPHTIDPSAYHSLVELIDEGLIKFADRAACDFMGKSWTYAQLDEASWAMGCYLQSLGLHQGDRVAVMMPNIPQYPVAVLAIIRAGFVLVNVNPLYTPRELEHQLKDSGAKVLLAVENFANTIEQVLARTPVQHLILTGIGDMLGGLKGPVVNFAVRRIKKMVPAYQLPTARRFNHALERGRHMTLLEAKPGPEDIAVLQYTGGTTGVSKGAMLLHRNIIANLLQSEAWNNPLWKQVPEGQQPVMVCALPLYHIFGFTVNMMFGLRVGARNILIPNPRDIPATLKALKGKTFHSFPAVNTLFNAMAHHPDFDQVDWRHLRISVGGGMAVQQATARLWKDKTGCAIAEGYGLSETSPSVTCNPVAGGGVPGSIGLPLPSTDVMILDEDGNPCLFGVPGELCVRGPQVMAGYWHRPEETEKVMTPDGFFRTGDIATMDECGYVRIVDRKKDMILVSGFNVYPSELEDVVTQMPGILECAAVGVPDPHSGEAVKLVIVREDPSVTEQQVREYCSQHLTGYKRPKEVLFTDALPKTPVGKILRRELRDPQ